MQKLAYNVHHFIILWRMVIKHLTMIGHKSKDHYQMTYEMSEVLIKY